MYWQGLGDEMRVIGGEFRVLGLRGERQKNSRNYPLSNKKGY